MKKYTNNNPQFFDEIDVVETTDPNHADNINKADKQTFENTLVNRNNIEQLEKNKIDKIAGKGLSTNDYTTLEKSKLSGIAEKANNYVHPASHPAEMITQNETHRFVSDNEKSSWNATLQSSKDYSDATYRQSTGYTDKKIADLINGAPETLDTLKEVADAIQANKTVADALTSAVGKKANQTELDTHTNNNTIHITSQERTNWNDANSKKHTHSNKSVLDGITSALISTWNKVTDKLDKTGDASNTTTSFSTASSRTNVTTGEKLSVSLSKIAKFFADLKTVAFTGSYADLSNKPTSLPANGGNASTVNNHTVEANVPANAKFTDTNTWRGVQNNLTSDSTNDSLSAAQGKVLKTLIDGKLPLSGGTLTGQLVEKQGHVVHKAGDSSGGKSGYISVATIKITNQYQNSPFEIAYCRRGDKSITRLYINFENSSGNDPALANFLCVGDNNAAYLYKSATSVWKLYICKSEAWDGIEIVDFLKPARMSNATVVWTDEFVTTLPTGTTQAKWGTSIGYAANATISAKLGKNGDVNTPMTFNWSGKTGQPTWLWGGENGLDMYVYNPSNFNVNSASKLATSRAITIAGLSGLKINFDGSSNVSVENWGYGVQKYVTTGSTTKPYFRIASIETKSNYYDASVIFVIDSGFNGGGFGIVKVAFRTNNIATANTTGCEVLWLVRQGFLPEQLFIKLYAPANGTQYADLYFKATGQYNAVNITALSSGGRNGRFRTWTFDNGDPRANADIRTYSTTVSGIDKGTVSSANTAGNASTVNGYTVNCDVPSNAKFTDTNTTYGVATQSTNGLLSSSDKTKLDGISTNGGLQQPIYFKNGVPTECAYSLASSVPPRAVFTDTTGSYTVVSLESQNVGKLVTLASGYRLLSYRTPIKNYSFSNAYGSLYFCTVSIAVPSGINLFDSINVTAEAERGIVTVHIRGFTKTSIEVYCSNPINETLGIRFNVLIGGTA